MNKICTHIISSQSIKYFSLLLILLLSTSPFAQDADGTDIIDVTADSVYVDTLNIAPPDVTPVNVKNVVVIDNPNDDGEAIRISWDKSVDDIENGKVTGYKVFRATSRTGDFEEIGNQTSSDSVYIEYTDSNTEDGVEYYYYVSAVNELSENGNILWSVKSDSDVAGPVKSSAQWFDMSRINVFIGTILICTFILYFINAAKSGKDLYIRKIAGLDAVDDAVGRATEMGKKVFFIPGINDMDNVQTIAGLTILGRVAQLTAEYETWIEVPVCKSLVMITARETVKESYTKAGRPDAFNEAQVHYITDDQFGYAAAVDGMFVREKPAAIFYMGAFFAESLIMAETGNSVGAIQIAGTGQPSQLPFFVAACDYTLIGEELFAASAYLSKEPKLLGSLKGQDMGKAVILVAILLGILLETFNLFNLSSFFTVIG
ncbi:MAG: fibronectin type III domain-containing protein [candidate division Zixibacteria bacterium]|nr:fibronectin type III domain-containing protein [candidate division Zixibacteria bacterium]